MSKIQEKFPANGRKLFEHEKPAIAKFLEKYKDMLTAKTAVEKEKDEMFNNIRHMIAVEHSCPKHLTMTDLKVILAILTVKQYDGCN